MRKKGFTLIELLAVIIILAIVALIATPIVLDVIEDARISAGKSEANMILGGINNYCANEEMKAQLNPNYTRICTLDMDKDDVPTMVNLGNAKILEIEYTDKLTWLKVESNGHIYSLQDNTMVEGDLDKPTDSNVPESVSFAEDSWETIAAIVKAGKAEETYNVGDTKEVTVEGFTNGSESTFTVRIANNSTPSECSNEGFSQTACGFVVEFVDIIAEYEMDTKINGTIAYGSNIGGWPATVMYNFLHDDIFHSLPIDLQGIIAETYTVSGQGDQDFANFTSNDKLYLLSTKEVWGKEGISNTINYDSAEAETRQLDYYENNGVTTDSFSETVKTYQGGSSNWWLRAARSSSSHIFYIVGTSGDWSGTYAIYSCGVAPAFRIG